MRPLLLITTLIASASANAQSGAEGLRIQLERIHDLDQNDRHNVGGFLGAQKDSVVAHMILHDSLNLIRVTAIIDSAGWLGADVIGQKANQALFLVIQHADAKPEIQAQYLPLMRDAVREGKANSWELALLEDRVRVNHGQLQIYGSQIGWKDNKPYIQPIEDEEHVNERRAAVRLEPLEKYAERFDLHWSPPVKQERVLLLGPTKH
ncbi:MAG: hypothetical protein IPM12_11375 [Flavobacteriales bacterium]|nr:hypothetical protein [Flavobacteriales bacterium]